MPRSPLRTDEKFEPITAEEAARILAVVPHSKDAQRHITEMVQNIRAKGTQVFTTPDAVLTEVKRCMPRVNEHDLTHVSTYEKRVAVFFRLLAIRERVRALGVFLNLDTQSPLTHRSAINLLRDRFPDIVERLSWSRQDRKGVSCFQHIPLITECIGGVTLEHNIAAAFEVTERTIPKKKRMKKNANNASADADRLDRLMTRLKTMKPGEISTMMEGASTDADRMAIQAALRGLEARKICGVS